MISPQEALFRLRDGNHRFVTTLKSPDVHLTLGGRVELSDTQSPFAVVLGCSDSRVPVELIFDQSVGDLFVIRVAGNVALSSQIGSVEYAAEQLGSRLVVVLGHTHCGAVEATFNEIQHPGTVTSENLRPIVEYVRPAFDDLPPNVFRTDVSEFIRSAVRVNVRESVRRLAEESPSLRELMRSDDLRIVGAVYDIKTGKVEFFDEYKTRERAAR